MRRLLLVVDYVLRVLRKIIVCVDSIERLVWPAVGCSVPCAIASNAARKRRIRSTLLGISHSGHEGSSSASQATRAGNVRRMSSSGCQALRRVADTVPVWRKI